mmetsp:Transcript_50566/g.146984  ORF Transcript_50566/g.146984 Transcript_50566/m.146984 type:complete len:108 (-) Transcript_50566:67-390(-)
MRFSAAAAAVLGVALGAWCARGVQVLRGSEAPGGAAHIDNEAFAKDWHREWQAGDYPSWKETMSRTWRHDDAVKYEDSQSDGKPSPGLTGERVGAYLPMPLPQEHGK